jgi:hypothetical protein
MRKPDSKFAFQVHKLQRYIAATMAALKEKQDSLQAVRNKVGLCTLESS